VTGAVTRVATTERVAALTFDDGPHPVFTPRLLDLLRRHEARATFFLVGDSARAHPHLVQRIAREGHAIGNHSWDHPAFPRIPGRERRRQLRLCGDAIAPYDTRLFRPPYGEHTLAVRVDAMRCGYDVVRWSLDVGDWWEPRESDIAQHLTEGIQPGSVVLLHDAIHDQGQPRVGPPLEHAALVDRSVSLAGLALALERLRGRMKFVTLPELLALGAARRDAGHS